MPNSIPFALLSSGSSATAALLDRAQLHIAEHAKAWTEHRWTDLLDNAEILSGISSGLLSEIRAGAALLPYAFDALRERDENLRTAFEAFRDSASEMAATARSHLRELAVGDHGEEAGAALADRLLNGDLPFSSARQHRSVHDSHEEWLSMTFAAASSVAVASRFAAELQLAAAKVREISSSLSAELPSDAPAIVLLDDDLALADSASSDYTAAALGGLQGLYNALRDDEGIALFEERALHLMTSMERRLAGASRITGAIVALLDDHSIEDARANASVLALIRSTDLMLLAHAYTAFVLASLSSSDSHRWHGHERRRTDIRNFEWNTPTGSPVEDTASLEDGAFVQIEGVVLEAIVIDDPAPPKFSTILRLHTKDGEFFARAHMFNLRNNGILVGVRCRLNGFVRLGVDWASGPAIDIDRVALTELRRGSWLSDVTFRMRPFFPYFNDEMNLVSTPLITQPTG